MANRFVRNIKQVRDINQQPLNTNTQNDLLSDKNNRVYVRTGDKYEPITGISEIIERMNDLDKNIKALTPGQKQNKLFKSIEDEFNALKKRYDVLTREIDNQNEEMEKIKLNMNGLSYQDDYDNEIQALKSKYDKAIADIKNSIDELRENVNLLNSLSIERQLKRLSDELDLIKKYVVNNQTDNANNQTDNEINEIKASIQDIYSKIYELNESMKGTEPEDDNINRQDLISELEKNIDQLWGVVNTQQSDISYLINKVGNIRSDISNISNTLKTLDQYVKKSDTENWQKHALTQDEGSNHIVPADEFIDIKSLEPGMYEVYPTEGGTESHGLPQALNGKEVELVVMQGSKKGENDPKRVYWAVNMSKPNEVYFGVKNDGVFLGWHKLAFQRK